MTSLCRRPKARSHSKKGEGLSALACVLIAQAIGDQSLLWARWRKTIELLSDSR